MAIEEGEPNTLYFVHNINTANLKCADSSLRRSSFFRCFSLSLLYRIEKSHEVSYNYYSHADIHEKAEAM